MVNGDDIIGSWVMVDRGTDSEEDRVKARDRYGDDPQGFMIFASDGWMNVIVCWGGRPALPGDPTWHTDAPEADKVRAFDTYLSYGGEWTVKDSVLTTKVRYGLNPVGRGRPGKGSGAVGRGALDAKGVTGLAGWPGYERMGPVAARGGVRFLEWRGRGDRDNRIARCGYHAPQRRTRRASNHRLTINNPTAYRQGAR